MNENASVKVQGEVSLHEIVLLLWKNKLLILMTILISGLCAILFGLTATPTYTSSAKLLTKSSSPMLSETNSYTSLIGLSFLKSATPELSDYLDQVIQNEDFLLKIINRKWWYSGDSLYLQDIWKMKPDQSLQNWKFVFNRKLIDKIRNSESIQLVKDKNYGIITLTTFFSEPQLAFDVNKFVIELLNEYVLTSIVSKAREKKLFIQNRISEIRLLLEKSENDLASFRERNSNATAPRVQLEEMRLVRDVTVNQEIYLQLQKQYELSKIEEKSDQPILSIIRNPEIPIDRFSPKRKLLLLLGIGIGLIIGSMFVFVKHWLKSVA